MKITKKQLQAEAQKCFEKFDSNLSDRLGFEYSKDLFDSGKLDKNELIDSETAPAYLEKHIGMFIENMRTLSRLNMSVISAKSVQLEKDKTQNDYVEDLRDTDDEDEDYTPSLQKNDTYKVLNYLSTKFFGDHSIQIKGIIHSCESISPASNVIEIKMEREEFEKAKTLLNKVDNKDSETNSSLISLSYEDYCEKFDSLKDEMSKDITDLLPEKKLNMLISGIMFVLCCFYTATKLTLSEDDLKTLGLEMDIKEYHEKFLDNILGLVCGTIISIKNNHEKDGNYLDETKKYLDHDKMMQAVFLQIPNKMKETKRGIASKNTDNHDGRRDKIIQKNSSNIFEGRLENDGGEDNEDNE
jgi:hypothetical protein